MNVLGNNPYGLRPVNNFGSSDKITLTAFPMTTGLATRIDEGDLVIFDSAAAGGGIAALTQLTPAAAATAVRPCGVFAGCEYYNLQGEYIKSNFWPAANVTFQGRRGTAFVYADPLTIFSIQCSSSAGTTATTMPGLNVTGVGKYVNINYGNTAAFPNNAYFDDGTLLQQNPTRGSRINGVSTAYADMLASSAGIAPTVVNNTASPALLQILGLEGSILQFSGSKQLSIPNTYMTAAANSIFPARVNPLPPFPAGALSIADGAFSRILVRINNHALSGTGFYA